MDDATTSDWFYRRDGRITITTHNVVDASPYHLENALAKQPRGEELTDPEAAALEAFKAAPIKAAPGVSLNDPDARLGLVAIRHRRILEALDGFAPDLKGEFGLEGIAWSVMRDYCDRAMGAAFAELGVGETLEDQFTRFADLGMTPERMAEIRAERVENEAFNEAWAASPEAAAAAAASGPDDGPEGWSQVPGREARGVALERQNAFARRYRAERGLEPLDALKPSNPEPQS